MAGSADTRGSADNLSDRTCLMTVVIRVVQTHSSDCV